eukprot:TRINITY_DN6195_c0_g1_i1.p1 TRINITY_DN6195_c0_g1~~TRINITY_DN6195_c0_g1_i1.p1  ORF type:complete len:109 (-),score=24.82 TRINITY_DN6195_c0_g1_i1:35-361(-)
MHYKELLEKLLGVAKALDSPTVKSMHYYRLFIAKIGAHPEIQLKRETCLETVKHLMQSVAHQDDLSKEEMETLILGLIINGKSVQGDVEEIIRAVSYTHLTLPTICSV